MSYTERLAYAELYSSRYAVWGRRLLRSPYSPLERLEFALLSAHARSELASKAFVATRHLYSEADIASALAGVGLLGSLRRARFMMALRTTPLAIPHAGNMLTWRAQHPRLPGLGHTKLSFGLALISPFDSDVCCLDTHIAREYGADVRLLQRSLSDYVRLESRLRGEAYRVDRMPLFLYQWAVWDYVRQRDYGLPPESHEVLLGG